MSHTNQTLYLINDFWLKYLNLLQINFSNISDQSKIKQQSISATNGNDSKLKKVDNSSILKQENLRNFVLLN